MGPKEGVEKEIKEAMKGLPLLIILSDRKARGFSKCRGTRVGAECMITGTRKIRKGL